MGQYEVLAVLKDKQWIDTKELSSCLGVSKNAVNNALVSLKKRNLVCCRRSTRKGTRLKPFEYKLK
jgi:predicted transcriptional regulator